MSSQNRKKITRKIVRQALKNCSNVSKLNSSMLTSLAIVAKESKMDGQLDPVIGKGVALRQILTRAIESLRPDDSTPVWNEQRWRQYLITKNQYLENIPPFILADRFNIARSTYNHAQAEALDRLVSILREWEEAYISAGLHIDAQKRPAIFTAPPLPPQEIKGRDHLVERLRTKLLQGQGQALLGLPGVGKTTLALLLAHNTEVLSHFLDGVLWARLGKEGNAYEALRAWAEVLGLDLKQLAKLQTTVELAEAVHTAIGLRRMLLVIDDAWSEESALVFRIGGPYCTHLLTTRLPEVATHFAGPNIMTVPELTELEGLSLLEQYTSNMTPVETSQARQLVSAVGGLPLALVLIGSQLQINLHQNNNMLTLFEILRNLKERLSIIQPQSVIGRHPSLPLKTPLSLDAILSLSEAALSKEARIALHKLSVFPSKPNTFSAHAAIAVIDVTTDKLDELWQFGLLEKQENGRLMIHQMISDYASLRMSDKNVKRRLVTYYIELLDQHENEFAFLQAESRNIWEALKIAKDADFWLELSRLARRFCEHLSASGRYQQMEDVATWALDASIKAGDKAGQAVAYMHLGRSALNRGHYHEAQSQFGKGLSVANEIADADIISRLLQGIGVVFDHLGQYDEARVRYEEGLVYARQVKNNKRIAILLMNLGGLLFDLGNSEKGERFLHESLEIARDTEYLEIMSPLLLNLGAIVGSRGDYDQEEVYYHEALDYARRQGNREDISYLLTNLGSLALDRGNFNEAKGFLYEGINIAREDEHKERLSALLRHFGELLIMEENYEQAQTVLDEGLELARDIQHQKNITALLTHLGTLHMKQKAFERAHDRLNESLTIATKIKHAWSISDTLRAYGELFLSTGFYPEAMTRFQESGEIAVKIEDRVLEALSLFGIARTYECLENYQEAKQFALQAREAIKSTNHRIENTIDDWLSHLV